MRILVISDSHGRNDDVAGVIRQVGPIDAMVHCGDVERGDDYVRSLISGPVYMVSGNNDYFLDLPPKIITKIGNYRVMIVHGHTYHVYRDTSYLRKCALEEKVDVVMFGHTHVPYIDIGPDLTILNPGSLSYPRQADRKPTFLMMEIDEDGNAHYGHGSYKSKFSELIL